MLSEKLWKQRTFLEAEPHNLDLLKDDWNKSSLNTNKHSPKKNTHNKKTDIATEYAVDGSEIPG